MNINTGAKRWVLPLGTMIVVSAIVVASWFGVVALRPETGVQTDVQKVVVNSYLYEAHSTLEGLSGAADAIVRGTVKKVAATGLSGVGEPGTPEPWVIYEFEVYETFKGDVSGTIYVGRDVLSALEGSPSLHGAPLTELLPGEHVVLYLHENDATKDASITLTDTVYVPIGFDNGVFDVSGTGPIGPVGIVDDSAEVLPRGIRYNMFAEGSAFTAADVRAAIEPDSGEDGPVGSVE